MNKIEYFIERIPEIYQRIYNHPEYDTKASRGCKDREKAIIEIVRAYQHKTGKDSVKVLDIGCAQGYFSFVLNDLGCEVYGIDYDEHNIELCRYLNVENETSVIFQHDSLNLEYVKKIDHYDVIICLNVLHHITHEYDFEYARSLITVLTEKSDITLFELALKSEPLYWNKNLPVNHLDYVSNIAFIKTIGTFSTHVSVIERPIIFCSNKYVLCKNELYYFTEMKNKSFIHGKVYNNKRTYFSEDFIIKMAFDMSTIEHDYNYFNELNNELYILHKYEDIISFFPKVISFEKCKDHLITILQIRIGILLYHLVLEEGIINYEKIINDILDNLIELEFNNLYHNDLRLWNIVIGSDGKAFLIDIGSINENNPNDIYSGLFGVGFLSVYDSFINFTYDLVTGKNYSEIATAGFYTLPRRNASFKVPTEYRVFFKRVAALKNNEVNFFLIKEIFKETIMGKQTISNNETEIAALFNMFDKKETDYDALLKAVNQERNRTTEKLLSLCQQLESQSQQLESQSQQLLHLTRVIQLVKLIKWLIKLPIRLVRWAVWKIKNFIRQILLNVMVLFARTPYLKYYAKILLRKAPLIENKLYKILSSINVALPSHSCRIDNIDMYLKEVSQYQPQTIKATSLIEIFRTVNDNQFVRNNSALLTSRIKEARNKEKSLKR